MRIINIATSLSSGAGSAAMRIHRSLLHAGVDSYLVSRDTNFVSNPGLQLEIYNLSRAEKIRSSGLTYLQKKFIQNGNLPISTYSNSFIKTLADSWGADSIINIHAFYNFLNLDDFRYLSERFQEIFITMHDQRILTGGCHNSFDCDRFLVDCTACPQVRNLAQFSVAKNFKTIRESFSNFSNISLISPSKWLQDLAIQAGVLPAGKIFFSPNPVPTEFFSASRNTSRLNMGYQDYEYVVGFTAAQLDSPFKGLEVFLNALEILGLDFLRKCSVKILLVGVGKVRSTVLSEITKVIYAESDAEMAAALSTMDLLVVPSLGDNSPSVIREAQAAGTAVIGSSVGGIPELVKESQLLFAPGNVSQLKVAIERQLLAPSKRKESNAVIENTFDVTGHRLKRIMLEGCSG